MQPDEDLGQSGARLSEPDGDLDEFNGEQYRDDSAHRLRPEFPGCRHEHQCQCESDVRGPGVEVLEEFGVEAVACRSGVTSVGA